MVSISNNYNLLRVGLLLQQIFSHSTLHLKIKKLSTNSPGDFDTVLDTINHYWIDPAK